MNESLEHLKAECIRLMMRVNNLQTEVIALNHRLDATNERIDDIKDYESEMNRNSEYYSDI